MKMKYGPNYQPDVAVPAKWTGYEFEYRHGFSWGKTPFVYNPVSAVRAGSKAREAWAAGKKDGKK
jgi:hypothetical protein